VDARASAGLLSLLLALLRLLLLLPALLLLLLLSLLLLLPALLLLLRLLLRLAALDLRLLDADLALRALLGHLGLTRLDLGAALDLRLHVSHLFALLKLLLRLLGPRVVLLGLLGGTLDALLHLGLALLERLLKLLALLPHLGGLAVARERSTLLELREPLLGLRPLLLDVLGALRRLLASLLELLRLLLDLACLFAALTACAQERTAECEDSDPSRHRVASFAPDDRQEEGQDDRSCSREPPRARTPHGGDGGRLPSRCAIGLVAT
jgi:hypothetical protein